MFKDIFFSFGGRCRFRLVDMFVGIFWFNVFVVVVGNSLCVYVYVSWFLVFLYIIFEVICCVVNFVVVFCEFID